MEENFGIVISKRCFLWKLPGSSITWNESEIQDEILSGWAVRILPEAMKNGWIKVETHYGYQGYVRAKELRSTNREEIWERQDKQCFRRINISEADLLDAPKVQGLPLETLLKNAFVELLSYDKPQGWSRIRTAAGQEGYIHTRYLGERRDDDRYLLLGSRDCFRKLCKEAMEEGEDMLRQRLKISALRYLGTQYRWGGKSSQGLDCSGLVFISYMENGVLIWRDAKLHPAYPIKPIPREKLKAGDLIFFPGHVAMYLGEGKYIHSTAYEKTPFVTIGSLNPCDEDYRGELALKITGYGSLTGCLL